MNVSKLVFDAVVLPPPFPAVARSIHACDAGERCHPSSVAAKLTSRHLG